MDAHKIALDEKRDKIKKHARSLIVAHEAINNQFIVTLSIQDMADSQPEQVVAYFRESLIGFVIDGHTMSDINEFVYDAMATKYPNRHIEVTVNDVENKIGYFVVYNISYPSQSILY